jgi:hypothetical protein
MSNAELAEAIAATISEIKKTTEDTYSLLLKHLDELLGVQRKRAAKEQNTFGRGL